MAWERRPTRKFPAAQAYIEKRLKPFVIGKNCDEMKTFGNLLMYRNIFAPGPKGTTR